MSTPKERLTDKKYYFLFRVYKKMGHARDEGGSIKRSFTPKEFKRRSSVGS